MLGFRRERCREDRRGVSAPPHDPGPRFGPALLRPGEVRPDGTAFEGKRYVDRYVVRRGKIVKMEVWNDSAEWLLVRAGLAKP